MDQDSTEEKRASSLPATGTGSAMIKTIPNAIYSLGVTRYKVCLVVVVIHQEFANALNDIEDNVPQTQTIVLGLKYRLSLSFARFGQYLNVQPVS